MLQDVGYLAGEQAVLHQDQGQVGVFSLRQLRQYPGHDLAGKGPSPLAGRRSGSLPSPTATLKPTMGVRAIAVAREITERPRASGRQSMRASPAAHVRRRGSSSLWRV